MDLNSTCQGVVCAGEDWLLSDQNSDLEGYRLPLLNLPCCFFPAM